MKGVLEKSGFFAKVLLLIGLMVVCSAISIAVWHFLQGDGSSVLSLKILQILQSVGMFIIPCLTVAFLWSKKPMAYLGLSGKFSWSAAVLVILFMIIALPAINLLSYLNQQMELPAFMADIEAWMKASEETNTQLTEQFMQADNLGGLFFNIFLMALLPALSEEMLFRGTIQNLLSEKNNRQAAIWVSAIIFSAIHMQFYGFVPRMLMGAIFGYMLVWSGSLWLPVLAHFTNNVLIVIVYYAFQKSSLDIEILDTIGTGSTLWLGIVSCVLVCVGIYLLRRSLTMSKASSRKSIGS